MHWPDLAAVQQVAVESTMDYTGWRYRSIIIYVSSGCTIQARWSRDRFLSISLYEQYYSMQVEMYASYK